MLLAQMYPVLTLDFPVILVRYGGCEGCRDGKTLLEMARYEFQIDWERGRSVIG